MKKEKCDNFNNKLQMISHIPACKVDILPGVME